MDILNGRYRLVERTASDLLGVTWIAEDIQKDDQRLRLRILSVDAADSDYVKTLINKFIHLATIVHPNIAQAYELDVIRTLNNRLHPPLQYFYTSEHIPTELSVSYLELTEIEIRQVIQQICYALNYVHFRGQAYKYLNFNTVSIQRSHEGIRVKLADLPTILRYREQIGVFSDEVEQFLPPEIIRDTDSNPTSDIYSLGVMIYYMYTGVPYQECEFDNDLDALHEVEIFKCVETMTAKNVSDRYANILEFVEAFLPSHPIPFDFIDRDCYEKLTFTTPLVGREREFHKILELIQQRIDLRTDVRLAVIQGEVGIGKTRMLKELSFYMHIKRLNALCVTVPQQQSKGYYLFRSVLRDIVSDINTSPELIKKYGSEIVKVIPEIADKWKLQPSEPLDEESEIMRLSNRIYNFMMEYSQSNPLVVFVDGFQNVSPQDSSVLEYLLQTRRKLPLIFVGTAPDESSPGYSDISSWTSREQCAVVILNKFGFQEAVELIQYNLGTGQAPISLAARIMADAVGNPKMIEEAMKTLFMFEYLHIQPNRTWSDPSESMKTLEFSFALDESKDYPLELFDPNTLRIMECVSIFDSPAPHGILEKMLNLESASVDAALEHLVNERIFNRKLGDFGYTYDFMNMRLRKKILTMLNAERIIELHTGAAEYLEDLNKQGNEIFSESLIYHLTRSSQLGKAAACAKHVAQKMMGINQNRQALEFYLLALRLQKDLKNEAVLAPLIVKVGEVYLSLNDADIALRMFAEAQEYASRFGQVETAIDARVKSCDIKVDMKAAGEVEGEIDEIIALAKEIGYTSGEIEAVLVKCRVLRAFGRFESINPLIAPYLLETRRKEEIYHYGRLMNEKGLCDIFTGKISDAFMALLESERCLEKEGNPIERVRPINNLGLLNFDYLGDLEKSRECFLRAIEISERANTVWGLDMLYSNLAETYMKEDDYQRALEYLNQACTLAENAQHYDMLFYIYSNLCITYLNCCQYDEAYRYLLKLDYEFANRKGHAPNIALYYLCHVRFAIDMRHFDSAREWHRRAYDEKIHISNSIEFEFGLLKLRIDHSDESNGNQLNLMNHLNALIKATTNALEICLIRSVIQDLAFESLNDLKRIHAQYLSEMDADLIEAFDTPRLRIRRALLEGMITEGEDLYFEKLLSDPAVEDYPLERWMLSQAAGRRHYIKGDYYWALVHYYTAMDAVKMMALRVPEKYRESFVLQDSMKIALYRNLHITLGRILASARSEFNQEPMLPANLNDFFEVKDEKKILSNQRFLNSVYTLYEEKSGVRFKSLENLIQNFGQDEQQNILLIMKYMVQVTFADRGFFFFNRDFEDNEDVICTDPDSLIPDISRFSVMLETDSDGVLIRNHTDLRIANPIRRATEALIVIPVRNESVTLKTLGRRRNENRESAGKVTGTIYLQSEKAFNNFTEASMETCRTLIRSLSILVDNYHLKRTSAIDKLTGVFLRKHIETKLVEELERSKANASDMAIVMADIDHFKNVNDLYGHQRGDEVLREIGRIIRTNLRNGDMVGRYGGEEFILVLPNAGDIDAYKVCEKIRKAIENAPILGDHAALTVSFGAASFPAHGVVEEELIEKADQALYESKHMGRNRTTVWTQNIGVSKQRFDKLTGILEGNISTDSRKVQAMVDIMSLINRPIAREAKIYEILSQLVDICEAQSASLVRIKNNAIVEKFTRTLGTDGLDRKAEIPEKLILNTAARGYGGYSVDWTTVTEQSEQRGVPDWCSYITIPMLYNGTVNGVLMLSVPISRHEFDFNGFNYVNTLSGVISVILNEVER